MSTIKGIHNDIEKGISICYDNKGVLKMESREHTDLIIESSNGKVDVHAQDLSLHINHLQIEELRNDSSWCPKYVTIDERGHIRAQTSFYLVIGGFFLSLQLLLFIYKPV